MSEIVKKKYREKVPIEFKKKTGPRGPSRWTDERLIQVGEMLIEWMNESPANIFFSEFLSSIGLYNNFLSDYEERCPEFAQIIKNARDLQELKLWKGGLAGGLNPALCIFALKNHHGARDRIETYNKSTVDLGFTKLLESEIEPATNLLNSGGGVDETI